MDSLVCQEKKIILLQWETIYLRTVLPERNTLVPVLLVTEINYCSQHLRELRT